MAVELIAQNIQTGKIYSLNEAVKSLEWQTSLSSQPGSLDISYLDIQDIELPYGSPISFKVDGKGVFFGYTFKTTHKNNNDRPITAYDSMRYLKNKDTYSAKALGAMTASERFEKICKDYHLKHKVVDKSSYKLPDRLFDNKTLFDILQDGMDRTLVAKNEWYMIRDNYGTLEFHAVSKMKSNLVIGDDSLLTGYDFNGSIDSDTYNQIKLIQEDSSSGSRDVYIVKDSTHIKQWGTLQYFEKVDSNLNKAQITEQATNLLKLKNRPTKTLKLTCLGDLRVYAGVGVVLSIKDLEREGIKLNSYYIVTSCTHKWEKNVHKMDLEVQVTV